MMESFSNVYLDMVSVCVFTILRWFCSAWSYNHEIGLLKQFGAYPVFVLDGTPSPLKSQARIMRFFRSSGIDLSSLPEAEKGVSVERNGAFKKCVKECMVSSVL